LLVTWLASATLLYAPLGVWFPRQGYPLLVLLSLLIGVVLAETVQRSRLTLAFSLAWLRAVWHLVPQVATIVESALRTAGRHG